MSQYLARFSAALFTLIAAASFARAQSTQPFYPNRIQTAPIPAEFTDPETKLRVVHLSRFASNYGGVVYFTYNTFLADSKLALIDAQYARKWRYLYTFDFESMQAKPLVTDRLTQNQVVVAKSGNVYYQADDAAWVVPITGGSPQKLCDLPARWAPGIGFTVNADETLLLGGSTDVEKADYNGRQPADVPNVLFTVNLKTRELKIVHREKAWLGHVQFSPTDPDLCMFCHEGSWGKLDRIWLLHPSRSTSEADGTVKSDAWIAFKRSQAGETAGHEFWKPDGSSIWFQHFRPGGVGSTLASLMLADGKITDYTLPAGFSGIHETFSPDGSFLIADGNGKSKTGPNKYLSMLTFPKDGSTLLVGRHLASLQDNDYEVEPNLHVSPDNRWVIFTATLHGTPQAYAVEMPSK